MKRTEKQTSKNVANRIDTKRVESGSLLPSMSTTRSSMGREFNPLNPTSLQDRVWSGSQTHDDKLKLQDIDQIATAPHKKKNTSMRSYQSVKDDLKALPLLVGKSVMKIKLYD
ncbi:hypothetical protein EG68_08713 [Paragonimus skrjabini miyazakii]|uniref:Uncharacterized protein n=1 Tax=Paragonimus skrjabini miyazakii TaxID=59628 RepID=A0A8S9YYR8_9TREM|nr:hypothetical protein EG68_08713 [Paragonimus skrjabini miyazakii]